MTGHRFTTENDSATLDEQLRTPTRMQPVVETDDVEVEEATVIGGFSAFITPRRKRFGLVLAPVLAVGIAATSFAVTRPGDQPLEAAPVVEVQQSVAARAKAPNREASRPALTPSASPAESAALSGGVKFSTLPSKKAAPAKKAATTKKAVAVKKATSASSARPTKKATPTRANNAKPENAGPAIPRLGEVIGSRYATQEVRVRATPSTGGDVLATLKVGQKVSVTAVSSNGFRQVSWNGRAAWVSSEFLAKSQPAAPKTTAPRTTSGGSSSGSAPAAGTCSDAPPSGVNSNAMAVYRAVCARWPQVSSYGGYRPTSDFHGQGRAVDIMISGSTGWEIANYLRANASRLGISELIYAQKIWTVQRSGEGWRSMSDRGGATANHYDHVHVSVY